MARDAAARTRTRAEQPRASAPAPEAGPRPEVEVEVEDTVETEDGAENLEDWESGFAVSSAEHARPGE
jgi:hypothetical protein